MYIRNRVDTSPTPVSWDVMCKHLFGFVAFMVFMFWVGDTFHSYQPVVSILRALQSTFASSPKRVKLQGRKLASAKFGFLEF